MLTILAWCHFTDRWLNGLFDERSLAKALGGLGGLKGGRAGAEKRSSTRRIEIAKKAARARWGKQP